MLALLRKTAEADRGLRHGVWHRWVGRRISELTIGVIGVGRVGRLVIRHLAAFNGVRILANDLVTDYDFAKEAGFIWTEKETIFQQADIITLHVPLTRQTRNLIGARELEIMKPDSILVNTARGGILDEAALAAVLRSRPAFSAAVDVFENEPYTGELTTLRNCLLTCHMASCTRDSRLQMELGAVQEVIRYFRGEPFATPVPEAEYVIQSEM
jgi:D-3-phosphoglycerate dehydrogenase